MKISFRTTSGSDPVETIRRKVIRLKRTTAEECARVGLFAREILLERTARGIDTDGVPFQSYAPSYEKKKGSGDVNLYSHYDGDHMLDLMVVIVAERRIYGEADVNFDSLLGARSFSLDFTYEYAKQKAIWNALGTSKMPARNFADFSSSEVNRIQIYAGGLVYQRMGQDWSS